MKQDDEPFMTVDLTLEEACGFAKANLVCQTTDPQQMAAVQVLNRILRHTVDTLVLTLAASQRTMGDEE